MRTGIAAPLLALIGHELRAPAGVVGGYLALLEQGRDPLTPAQRSALDGARRAQQSLVEALDDMRRLTAAWQAEADPATWVALPRLAEEVRALATARGVPLTLDAAGAVAVPRRGRDAALAEGLVTVAEAVAREHGVDVVATADVEEGALVWRLRPVGAPPAASDVVRHEFNLWRPGLGVRLVAAAVAVAGAHGVLHDVRLGKERCGVDITFDLTAAPPPVTPSDAA